MPHRDNFSPQTKETLARRTGFVCSNPDCRAFTVGPASDPEKSVNLGVAAHITAAASGGPRYKKTLGEKERTSSQNGIWLCATCASLVDRDVEKYSEWLLIAWKDRAERTAEHSITSRRRIDAGADDIDQDQYRSYTEAFASLERLRESANNLWEDPDALTAENLDAFDQQRTQTKTTVMDRAIFFEQEDFKILMEAFYIFRDFLGGKSRLRALVRRRRTQAKEETVDRIVREQIAKNRNLKERYDEIVRSSHSKFVERLRRIGGKDEGRGA